MDGSQGGVAVLHGRGQDAEGQVVINLTHVDPLDTELLIEAREVLDPAGDLAGNALLRQLALQGLPDLLDEVVANLAPLFQRRD